MKNVNTRQKSKRGRKSTVIQTHDLAPANKVLPKKASAGWKKDFKKKHSAPADKQKPPISGSRGKSKANSKPSAVQARALELLRQANDLPMAYAALHILQNDVGFKDFSKMASNEDKGIIEHALLAVPYLMLQRARQLFQEAGLKRDPQKIFETIGPECCHEKIDQKGLMESCSFLSRSQASKVLPLLKKVGMESRSKLGETRED